MFQRLRQKSNDILLFNVVSVAYRKRLSTKTSPCVEDPQYNSFKCMMSYFYKQRGCQYPWNVYKDLDLPVCLNYTEIGKMLRIRDPKKGYESELLGPLERKTKSNNTCLQGCSSTKYEVKWQEWENWRSGRSLQIAFSDNVIEYREEHLACDLTCILGEFGGNLGFFLGGSLFLALTYILNVLAFLAEYGHRRCVLKQT